MPAKYMIHTRPAPHRFERITKSGIIAWEEGCLKCAVCVKKKCVYGVYDHRNLKARQMVDSIDNQCMNCFRCVQNCPKELIHKSLNPEYRALGDAHWTPDIIARLWYQAETGKIPVSGAGYPGPFSGPGFDSMWTDMSEIVRPTRDGIHGREYISTAVDLGRKPRHLSFAETGELTGATPSVVSIPFPIVMRMPRFGALSQETLKGWALAARRLDVLLALPREAISPDLSDFAPHLMPIVAPEPAKPRDMEGDVRLIEIGWSDTWQATLEAVRVAHPGALLCVGLPLDKGAGERVLPLIEAGVSIIHLEGGEDGRTRDDRSAFIKDGIRSVHLDLVDRGLRDEITLIASGGISMAEHVAKSLICGADAVCVDLPILIALECRMCRRCTKGLSCPVEVDKADPAWVARRVINLLGAWHNQLLEVMGAMGIRDARRMRGESGRAMFFEELDRTTFESMGVLKEGCELE